MDVRASYRQAVISDEDEAVAKRALTEVVDDLIGLESDAGYVAHLQQTYGAFLGRRGSRRVAGWINASLPPLFLHAARAASDRKLDPLLAPHLARVTFAPDGPDAIRLGDLPALGAWSLLELVRGQPIVVTSCDACGVLFVTVKGSSVRYCNRPARGKDGGRLTRSCREVEREHVFFESRAAYRREYRNVFERVNDTKTLPEGAFALWKEEFGPKGPEAANPQRFDAWIELGLTARGRKAARLVEEHHAAQEAAREKGGA